MTGITPALGENVAEICIEACKKAKEKNLTVSLDLNFRKKLWTSEEANKTMSKLMPYVDICMANEEDAEKVFGIKAKDSNIIEGKLSHEGYKEVAKKIIDKFKVKKVGITLRGSISASENLWSCMLYNGEEYFFSKEYLIKIVDRVGGGDSFSAGLIYSFLNDKDDKEALEFANKIGYHLVVRPAYTLGGTGGGFARNEKELIDICETGLKISPVGECLIEKSIAGYKEIEYEVMRDNNDNAIVVCNMENVDPVGIHTGDSIVVAPCQTLSLSLIHI